VLVVKVGNRIVREYGCRHPFAGSAPACIGIHEDRPVLLFGDGKYVLKGLFVKVNRPVLSIASATEQYENQQQGEMKFFHQDDLLF
jgi:hypothetical protein